MAGRKPMSAMRSASSTTAIVTPSSRTAPRATGGRSRRLGQSDGYVDAAAEVLQLRTEADAPVQRGNPSAVPGGGSASSGPELPGNLGRQLAGRECQDQCCRAAGAAVADARGQGDPEGECLTRPGGGFAADVLAGEGGRDGRALDGRWDGDALGGEAAGRRRLRRRGL